MLADLGAYIPCNRFFDSGRIALSVVTREKSGQMTFNQPGLALSSSALFKLINTGCFTPLCNKF